MFRPCILFHWTPYPIRGHVFLVLGTGCLLQVLLLHKKTYGFTPRETFQQKTTDSARIQYPTKTQAGTKQTDEDSQQICQIKNTDGADTVVV